MAINPLSLMFKYTLFWNQTTYSAIWSVIFNQIGKCPFICWYFSNACRSR